MPLPLPQPLLLLRHAACGNCRFIRRRTSHKPDLRLVVFRCPSSNCAKERKSAHSAYSAKKDGTDHDLGKPAEQLFFCSQLLVFSDFICTNNFLLGVSPSYHAEDADDAACSVSPPLSICKIPTALIGNWPIELSSRTVPQWPINYDSDCSRLEALFMAGSVFYGSFLCFCFMFYARSINESKYNIISLTVVCASGLNFFFDWVPLA